MSTFEGRSPLSSRLQTSGSETLSPQPANAQTDSATSPLIKVYPDICPNTELICFQHKQSQLCVYSHQNIVRKQCSVKFHWCVGGKYITYSYFFDM